MRKNISEGANQDLTLLEMIHRFDTFNSLVKTVASYNFKTLEALENSNKMKHIHCYMNFELI